MSRMHLRRACVRPLQVVLNHQPMPRAHQGVQHTTEHCQQVYGSSLRLMCDNLCLEQQALTQSSNQTMRLQGSAAPQAGVRWRCDQT